jgi:DNA mismatch endonuclease (patch repair protein)
MRLVRGDGLKPEARLAAALAALGVECERNAKSLPGKPDFVFEPLVGQPLALQVDGCFWHRCPRHCKVPKTRTEHWDAHLAGNVRRDRRTRVALRKLGYRTKRVWEHSVKTDAAAARVAKRIKKALAI